MVRTAPSYKDLRPASPRASRAARGSSKKADTKPELMLRRILFREGYRYRKDASTLPGRPDIVFAKAKVAIFCDGDFWHGREWAARKSKLVRGANAPYWISKIEKNVDRDLENQEKLELRGWRVLRFWEGEIRGAPEGIAAEIISVLDGLAD